MCENNTSSSYKNNTRAAPQGSAAAAAAVEVEAATQSREATDRAGYDHGTHHHQDCVRHLGLPTRRRGWRDGRTDRRGSHGGQHCYEASAPRDTVL